jgi:hypothetical protein
MLLSVVCHRRDIPPIPYEAPHTPLSSRRLLQHRDLLEADEGASFFWRASLVLATPPGKSGHRGEKNGINEMDPTLCGLAVISHNEVSKTDHQRTARRTSPMKQELSTVAIDLAKNFKVTKH